MRVIDGYPNQKVPIKMWTDGVQVEDEAIKQLTTLAELPFLFKHVAVMPDVHAGIGSTVGSVIATKGAVIPAAVGVDIGCGMRAAKTSLKAADLPDSLLELRFAIEKAVPHGRTDGGGANDRGAWGNPPAHVEGCWRMFQHDMAGLVAFHPALGQHNGHKQLGTLGTGNHFIELCLDNDQYIWVVLHSGSRGFGNRIGTYFGQEAKKLNGQFFIDLPHPHLAYIPQGTSLCVDYLEAVAIAQHYAKCNRMLMMDAVLQAMRSIISKDWTYAEVVDCHHNYLEMEHHYGHNVFVTRKGAVRAREGDLGIIPGSMGTRSYIVKGRGCAESFCSCSHGAGRLMSRTQAKKTFTLADHELATKGVECRRDQEVLDETPGAYKPIEAVMAAQTELVDVVTELKQILCVKG